MTCSISIKHFSLFILLKFCGCCYIMSFYLFFFLFTATDLEIPRKRNNQLG
ncbi:hypothetical protein BD560DRAFT_156533 [Blakeslea trispora]|nr:hypothetical protein BD560DRAFT_156533 [Blakeslea trispora]